MPDKPLPDDHRQLAIIELERIADTLMQMSAWADGASADRERLAIACEDGAKAAMVAAYLMERADRVRVSELVSRRVSSPAADGQTGR
jgi:hypothetical protein